MPIFQRATKKQLKARIALDGPAGGGKTYTGLRFAFALAGEGGRVAVIDTEHRSASKYQGDNPDGIPWNFDVCELEEYSPTTYTNVIEEAGRAGYDVLLIDSLSHAWEGIGGALDIVDRKAPKTKAGSFGAWREVTPLHRKMIDAILSSPCHIVATMRTKTAYELEEDEQNGKKKLKVQKIGTKPIQREGVEYEFDVVGDLDLEHLLVVSKSRCPALDGQRAVKPGPSFIQPLMDWLKDGTAETPARPTKPATKPSAEKKRGGVKLSGKEKSVNTPYSESIDAPCGQEIATKIADLAKGLKIPAAKIDAIKSAHGAKKLADLPRKEAEKLLAKLEAKASEAEAPF